MTKWQNVSVTNRSQQPPTLHYLTLRQLAIWQKIYTFARNNFKSFVYVIYCR